MKTERKGFLPVTRADMKERGWDQLDIILVSGDAYVDHPSFGAAILGRFLESKGYRVGIIAQPNWHLDDDFKALGKPRLFFGVTAGNLDSMLNHYTSEKAYRKEDAYSPGGKTGKRPDRATIVYTNRLRSCYPGVPVVIGGIEASMRRLAHYDYWSDSVRRSLLLDSKADLLVYGMGEYTLWEIARRMDAGELIQDITDLRGIVYSAAKAPKERAQVILPSFEEVAGDKKAFAQSYASIYKESNPYRAKQLVQQHGDRWVVQNPPLLPLTTAQLDAVYELPFARAYHPDYNKQGGVPAFQTVQFSMASHRGCFGGCSFCTLALHQGRFIQSRSETSLLAEAELLAKEPGFKGTITDVGGPTANMYRMGGSDLEKCHVCTRLSCLTPRICSNLDRSHQHSIRLLRSIRGISRIKHVFIQSGIRHDLIMADADGGYLEELCAHHVGGQLKIAVEHISPGVVGLMSKPKKQVFLNFAHRFKAINEGLNKKQYLVSYFISGHPGCGVREMIELAEFVRDHLGYHPEQVQSFTPTPMSLSTCIYYTGINPLTGEKVYVPRTEEARKMQRAVLQYRDPQNRELVRQALIKCSRRDLIGNHPKALAAPEMRKTEVKDAAEHTDGQVVVTDKKRPDKQGLHKGKPAAGGKRFGQNGAKGAAAVSGKPKTMKDDNKKKTANMKKAGKPGKGEQAFANRNARNKGKFGPK